MWDIVDKVKVYFVVDMVYIFGFVVVKVMFGLFGYVDIVMMIFYKFFCGFCGVLIFFCCGVRKVNLKIGVEELYNFENFIN